MRALFAVPHYFGPGPEGGRRHGSLGAAPAPRIQALSDTLAGIRQLFGRPQCVIDIANRTTVPANQGTALGADVVVCTTRGKHLLDRLPLGAGYFTHHPTDAEPRFLGFECHAVLRDRLAAGYDYYCYLEDDLLIRNPLFFVKLRWFARQFGEDALLMPNRYEVARDRIVHKAYIDGPIRAAASAAFQDVTDAPELAAEALGQAVTFQRSTNPHCGGFFLTPGQLAAWAAKPYFLDRSAAFIGPLESAATLGVMRTFRTYKPAPACAAFLELEHPGTAFLSLIVPPTFSLPSSRP
jgi:hypothetical protein